MSARVGHANTWAFTAAVVEALDIVVGTGATAIVDAPIVHGLRNTAENDLTALS
jgi:quercetin dioxygenase-like cupin family protein